MKKIFFGLAVAAVALSASAFANTILKTTFSVAYIIDFDPSTQEYTFVLADPGPAICPNTSLPFPCGVTPISYSMPTGTNRISRFLIDAPDTIWDSTRDSF